MLSVLAIISLGFLLFLIFTSNPFERILPIAPEEGGDLNPLLQDFGLIIHPPLLYMGPCIREVDGLSNRSLVAKD